MRVQIEDEHSTAAIETNRRELTATDAVKLCYRALLGMSYHPRSISEAMCEVGEENS
jgi:hypothetical protein